MDRRQARVRPAGPRRGGRRQAHRAPPKAARRPSSRAAAPPTSGAMPSARSASGASRFLLTGRWPSPRRRGRARPARVHPAPPRPAREDREDAGGGARGLGLGRGYLEGVSPGLGRHRQRHYRPGDGAQRRALGLRRAGHDGARDRGQGRLHLHEWRREEPGRRERDRPPGRRSGARSVSAPARSASPTRSAQNGGTLHAGQVVRLIDVRAGTASGTIAEDCPDAASVAALASRLYPSATTGCFGTVGRVFLERLCGMMHDAASATQVKDALRHQISAFCGKLTPASAGNDVRTVVGHFGLIAFGGELATQFGFTGWSKGDRGRPPRRFASSGCRPEGQRCGPRWRGLRVRGL